jgi:hypothetical protein
MAATPRPVTDADELAQGRTTSQSTIRQGLVEFIEHGYGITLDAC